MMMHLTSPMILMYLVSLEQGVEDDNDDDDVGDDGSDDGDDDADDDGDDYIYFTQASSTALDGPFSKNNVLSDSLWNL